MKLTASKRATIFWYVLYGLIIIGTDTVFWWLLTQNRFLDAGCILLIGTGALWASIINHHDDHDPW